VKLRIRECPLFVPGLSPTITSTLQTVPRHTTRPLCFFALKNQPVPISSSMCFNPRSSRERSATVDYVSLCLSGIFVFESRTPKIPISHWTHFLTLLLNPTTISAVTTSAILVNIFHHFWFAFARSKNKRRFKIGTRSKARACYPLKYRSSSFFHFAIRRASAAEKRASNSRRSFSIFSSLAPGWSAPMDCRNQRRAVSDSSAHWRNPSWAVRGNRTVFISAFTRSIRRSQRGGFLVSFILLFSCVFNFTRRIA
jgi:hypothetical protein